MPFVYMVLRYCSMGLEDWNFAIMTYGDTWRKTRRIFHSQMHSNAAPRFQSVQKRQARAFLKQLLEDPTELAVSVRGYVTTLSTRRPC